MDRPPPPPERPAYLVALFVAVIWASVVFAVDGVVSVLSDRDPVPPGESPYYGLLATALAGIVVWFSCGRAPASRLPVLPALAATAGVYLVITASGAVGGFRLVAAQATSWFTVIAAVGAGVAAVATWGGMRAWHARTRRAPGGGASR